ncbi:hypothetical protein EV426DRAFT_702410 [Tirmania nivea]|nr:hypothetical protein EV426DRAFT_702410 [Tirmania nivea]
MGSRSTTERGRSTSLKLRWTINAYEEQPGGFMQQPSPGNEQAEDQQQQEHQRKILNLAFCPKSTTPPLIQKHHQTPQPLPTQLPKRLGHLICRGTKSLVSLTADRGGLEYVILLSRLGLQYKRNKQQQLWDGIDCTNNHFDQPQRKVGTQQPEQLQTSGQHHEIALAAHNKNIYSDLGGTAFANLSPSFEAFQALPVSALSHKPTLDGHWSTTLSRAPTPRATPDAASKSLSTDKQDNSHTTTPPDATRHTAKPIPSY